MHPSSAFQIQGVPEVTEQEAGYTLASSPLCHRPNKDAHIQA